MAGSPDPKAGRIVDRHLTLCAPRGEGYQGQSPWLVRPKVSSRRTHRWRKGFEPPVPPGECRALSTRNRNCRGNLPLTWCHTRSRERRAALSQRKDQSRAGGASPLSHNQLVALDVETRTRRRPGVGIVHRRRARQHNERPQLGKVLTPIVKIRKAIPPQESFAGAIPFAPHCAAKSRPQLGLVLTILVATNLLAPLVGNGIGQIPLGRIASVRHGTLD